MSDQASYHQAPRPGIGLFLLAGIGAGAVTGIVFGLLATRQTRTPAAEMGETVDDLKRRAEQILQELSQPHSVSDSRKR